MCFSPGLIPPWHCLVSCAVTPFVCLCALQENVRRICGPVQSFVEFCGQGAIDALKNMEGKFPVTPLTFRDLRAVATPEAAQALLSVMVKDKVTKKQVDSHMAQVIHDMLVDWHWCPENPFIHPEKRVPPLLPLCTGLHVCVVLNRLMTWAPQ